MSWRETTERKKPREELERKAIPRIGASEREMEREREMESMVHV